MGNIFRIQIKRSRDDDNDDSKDASLILKCAPTSPIRRERIGVRNVFLREITMYDEVNKFIEFLSTYFYHLKKNIPKNISVRFRFYPSSMNSKDPKVLIRKRMDSMNILDAIPQ